MLDRVHAHRTFADGRGALDRFKIIDPGVNCRLVLQILALELNPVIDRRRMQFQRDFFSGVQRRSVEAGGLDNGRLKLGRGSHV
jgi:hypothetical protein